MKLNSRDAYFEERSVSHVAQGDIYEAVPFSMWTVTPTRFEPSGARKRYSGDTGEGAALLLHAPGVLLHYTCGMTAQPPGTEGYAHEYRLLAPIVSLGALKRRFRMNNNELKKIREGATLGGFMYLPQTVAMALDDPSADADQWTGHAAALIYRPASVSQEVLDARRRLHQMTGPAIKILNAHIIGVFSPNDFRAEDLANPDLADGWAPPIPDKA